MLMNHIDENEKYQFVANTGDRLHLVFATRETIEQAGGVKTPLWSREAGDDRTMRAMVRWAAQHRAHGRNGAASPRPSATTASASTSTGSGPRHRRR